MKFVPQKKFGDTVSSKTILAYYLLRICLGQDKTKPGLFESFKKILILCLEVSVDSRRSVSTHVFICALSKRPYLHHV